MKAPKQITKATTSKLAAITVKPTIIDKLKPSGNLNFSLGKDVNFDESEIRISVKGNEIVARFLSKGVLVMEQVVLVKPKPTPPPIKPRDIIKALESLKLKFSIEK